MSKEQTLSEIDRLCDLRERTMRLAAQMLFTQRWDAAMEQLCEAHGLAVQVDELTAEALDRFYITVKAAA